MKRSFLWTAVLAVFALATLVFATITHAATTVYATCRAFKNLIVDSFVSLATTEPGRPQAVSYARAKAFTARILKRDRPVVTASWRMCPSI